MVHNHNIQEQSNQPVSHDRVLRIFRSCSSLKNFATKLMLAYFTEQELTQPNVNVTGQRPKGMTEPVNGLDHNRMEIIRETVLGYTNGSVEAKMSNWLQCTKAMSKKMAELKKYARIRNF